MNLKKKQTIRFKLKQPGATPTHGRISRIFRKNQFIQVATPEGKIVMVHFDEVIYRK